MMGRRLLLQVRALIKKDFIIIAAHKRTMILELIFPLLMTALSCLMLTLFLRMSAQEGDNSWQYFSYTPGCNTIDFFGVTPANTTFNLSAAGQCVYNFVQNGYSDHVGHYDNWTSLYDGFETSLYQQQPGAAQQQMSILTFQWNEIQQNLTAHQRMLGSSAPISIGAMAYSFFRNSSVYVEPGIMPNPSIYNSKVMFALSAAIMLNFAFFPMASTMAGRLVDEKNAKVREHLRVMGISSSGYLIAAFCTAAIRVMFVSLPMLIMICSFKVVSFPDALFLLLCFICFGFSLAGFAQIMPAFFAKSSFSNAAVSLFLAIGTVGAPFVTMLPAAAHYPFAIFFSPVASVLATAQIFGNTSVVTLPISPGLAVVFLLLQVFGYAFLSQYLYAINPGEYGVPRSPLFPIYAVMAFFKGSQSSGRQRGDTGSLKEVVDQGSSSSPSSPANARVVLDGLYKYYGSQRDTAAVNDLSLTINQKEIFALLGHNGAGKTTTISILTGMTPSTSYRTASLLGYDIDSEMHLIRQNIGSCPQFDVLFEDLSATQHLDLFAALKGLSKEEHRGEELLRKLKLPITDQASSTFSGGMKRRLSVANALVGDSSVLFLDEPSSGLDPVSRRQLWELLKEEKQNGKTIILTTHFMEEADYLGDRIAIMSHGRQYCCDTSSNLKQTYGVGYYLKLVKAIVENERPTVGGAAREVQDGHFNRAVLEQIMARHNVNGVYHHESVGDCTYLLPQESLPVFGNLLEDIEKNLAAIGASSYGMAMNTLEDVFVSISESEAAKSSKTVADKHNSPTNNTVTLPCGVNVEDAFYRATHEVSSLSRFWSQVVTVMYKKILFMKRSKRLLFMGMIVPIILVAIGYASVIPNFLNQNMGNSEPYGWWFSDNLPDMNSLHIATVVRNSVTENHTPTADMKAVMTKWQYYYREMRKKQGFDSHLTYEFLTPFEFNTGMFLKQDSISWFSRSKPALQMLLDDIQLLPDSRATLPANYSEGGFAKYNYIFDDSSYSDAFLTMVDPTFRAALDAVAMGEDGPVPNVIVEKFVIPKSMMNSTLPPTPAPTMSATPSPSDDNGNNGHNNDGDQPKYLLIVLGIMVVVAISQYSANASLFVADELNRRVFHTMRIHGCTAVAYWVGTLLIDLSFGCVLLVAYIIGAYARGVTQIQNMLLLFQSVMIFMTTVNSLLIAYAVVCVLPENLKQNTYIAAVNAFLTTLLAFPLIIYLSVEDPPTFLTYLTPPRALFHSVITYHSDYNDIWSKSSTVGSLLFGVAWNIPPAFIVWWHSYITSLDLSKKPDPLTYSNPDGSAHTAVPIGAVSENSGLLSSAAPVTGAVMDDPDVLQEVARVRSAPTDCMAATMNLRKVYHAVATDDSRGFFGRLLGPKTDKLAVQNLTFGIQAGECFGLLGPNGAGKTTTVKMMLREIMETAGSVTYPYHQHAVEQSRDTTYRYARLGCCQQHDTLWELLTAEEHMRIYLRLRLGPHYDAAQWEPYIQSAINKVHLEDAEEKRAGAFSGGMKRKLAVALALYSGARTVFLDEPSTGMDPYARRALWRSINEALLDDRCVLLTTHSMEEADAVCARIAIMTNGTMKCIGNSQHLKNRFGAGYTITLTLAPQQQQQGANRASIGVENSATLQQQALTGNSDNGGNSTEDEDTVDPETVTNLDKSMKKAFGSTCELKEVLGLQLRFSVGTIDSLAFAFRTLQENASSWSVANYSVAQLSSLEQIFINFAGAGVQHGN